MNLGVLPFPIMPNVCPLCSEPIGRSINTAYHALSCKHLIGKLATDRHDAIQAEVELGASRAHIPHSRHDLTDAHGGDRRATDTTFNFPGCAKPVDYVVTDPCCKSYVHRSAKHQLGSAEHASHRKHRHHHIQSNSQATSSLLPDADREVVSVASFSVETFGGVHDEANEIMKTICIGMQNHTQVFDRSEIAHRMRGGVAVAIARGNAKMIRACQRKAAKPHAKYQHDADTYYAPNHIPIQPNNRQRTYTLRRRITGQDRARPVVVVDDTDFIDLTVTSSNVSVSSSSSLSASSSQPLDASASSVRMDAVPVRAHSVPVRSFSVSSVNRRLAVEFDGAAAEAAEPAVHEHGVHDADLIDTDMHVVYERTLSGVDMNGVRRALPLLDTQLLSETD